MTKVPGRRLVGLSRVIVESSEWHDFDGACGVIKVVCARRSSQRRVPKEYGSVFGYKCYSEGVNLRLGGTGSLEHTGSGMLRVRFRGLKLPIIFRQRQKAPW